MNGETTWIVDALDDRINVIDPDGIRVELISTRRAVTEFSQEEATLASERAG